VKSVARVMCERESEAPGGGVAVEGSGSYAACCEEKKRGGESRRRFEYL
jgi:hypothetical protein